MTDDPAGPWFEDLAVGDTFEQAPSVTLTSGQAALHQAITGDRLRLPLDYRLSGEVTGDKAPVAHPALVWDIAIGQSTLVTGRAVANLFYRGLVFRRAARLGDTLSTTTRVTALRQNSRKAGRPATGLAVLRIRTVDQEDRPVLDFLRCAMLPLSDGDRDAGRADDVDRAGDQADPADLAASISGWRLDRYLDLVPTAKQPRPSPGTCWHIDGDVVSAVPELARLTLNIAAVHHVGHPVTGQRLVYGGHTIGLALSHCTRALPGMVTVVGWHGCDHLAPVREGDALASQITVQAVSDLPGGGSLCELHVQTRSLVPGREPVPVLDWRPVVVLP
jgi:acyl dehydratase